MIDKIHKKLLNNQYEFSEQAINQTLLRQISVYEIKQAVLQGKLIEDYPDDKYGPSCLIFGLTEQKRPLHIHCSYPTRSLIKIITVYQPSSKLWINYEQRRQLND
ncbi:DUF4258 domain-containing protein [Crocosphaera chwakensis]|uniref:DUF4258 domain-containing protein n=1 Tax=Crocosphaera chwakensis CCY0110 TaxID=391612 RepID=A3INA8_9CHRO|nr:DUF4258 domain-containing protein [Crocosphaera chwakensis]EAZ92085.1 hypothetical protein CY0110_00465 [Crocosphaera chwakensis CCY0110]